MKQDLTATRSGALGGLQNFYIIWFGQFVSGFGTTLTRFALVLWVFEQTRSVTQQSLISFFTLLPSLLFSPFAGVIADRWNRRLVLFVSSFGASLSAVVLFALLVAQQLQTWHIYLLVINSALFMTLQIPAFSASIVMLVPKEQLSRANSVVQVGGNLSQLIGPLIAGVLLGQIGLVGIVLIDLATFVVALLTLIITQIPQPVAETPTERKSLLREAAYGWSYLRQYPALVSLLVFFAISNYVLTTVSVLAPSLVLSFTTATDLGAIFSASGLGMLAGGLLMSIWGNRIRPTSGIFGGLLLSAVFMVVGGLAPSTLLIGTAAFWIAMGVPVVIIATQTIWQRTIAPEVQGRVAAIRMMVVSAGTPLAYLLSGLLVDYLFRPLLLPDGLLADSVGQLIGTGPGRGTALLLIILGLLLATVVAAAMLSGRLRAIDTLADAA